MAFELLPGQPLTLAYRLIIRSGEGLQKTSSSLFNDYVKKNCRTLFEALYHDTTIPSTQRGAALISMARLNPQEVSQIVVEALTGKDVHLRHAATAALRTLDSSVLEVLLKRFPALPLESQWSLVPLWAEHRFTPAEPTIIGCLTSADETLRLEAVRALRKLGSAAAIPCLLEAGAKGGPLAKEIEVTLQHMQGKDVTTALQASSIQTNKPDQATLAIKALGSRMDPGTCDLLLGIAATGTTKDAELALTTLKNQATAEALPRLRILLLEKPDLTDSLTQAIIAICKRQPDQTQTLSTFLDTPIKAAIESQLRELQMKNVEK
jgi:HEAT repeat protein